MTHAHEKSDEAIVAAKPANNAERSAAEPVERRAEAEGNASQHGMGRMPSRGTVTHALDRIRRTASSARFAVTHPRWEPYALIGPVRFCAGGAQ
jgi:hypothetical protein